MKINLRRLVRNLQDDSVIPTFPISVIIGDGAVGKTCFLHRYIKREYEDNENYTPTIFENYSKEVDVNGEKKSIRFNIFNISFKPLLSPLEFGIRLDKRNMTESED